MKINVHLSLLLYIYSIWLNISYSMTTELDGKWKITQMTFKNVVFLNRDEFGHCETWEPQSASTSCKEILP